MTFHLLVHHAHQAKGGGGYRPTPPARVPLPAGPATSVAEAAAAAAAAVGGRAGRGPTDTPALWFAGRALGPPPARLDAVLRSLAPRFTTLVVSLGVAGGPPPPRPPAIDGATQAALMARAARRAAEVEALDAATPATPSYDLPPVDRVGGLRVALAGVSDIRLLP